MENCKNTPQLVSAIEVARRLCRDEALARWDAARAEGDTSAPSNLAQRIATAMGLSANGVINYLKETGRWPHTRTTHR